ncbi:serine/threonine-protein kinase [Actinoplanes couchii]|uniref:non-specific serine/threonine protein kinase n=1 Tax=Actinoplanes couchii TaxID=403638 RepID=A0ABQ3X9J9_9ACTN|nr:serine/threonine-protein kinase [Actinoplanes couchii]MDR6325672.1 serine/threonine protein kinase [Actinoplanes couchii]GID55160.1 hypothetical protein Aco03nite_035640 [Actinoplanes couchii]
MAVRQRLVAGRYRLLEPVGAGGMGRVWLARDEMLHRDVAVKEIVPPEWLTEDEQARLRQRTLREARSAARLNHPNVVRIYDVVNDDGLSWIVMEYVESRSLQQVLLEDGPYGPAVAARIGLAVLDALAAAHRAGVLHRDVKPHNVLIGTDGRVVLTDFGLATFVDDGSVTAPGLIVGSPQYVSPERGLDGASTVESDLWSLGATLYAAVEGQSPYARETAMATLAALATEPPDPPVRAGPLTPILAGLLRYEPADRLTAPQVERRLRRIVVADPREIPLLPTQRTPSRPRHTEPRHTEPRHTESRHTESRGTEPRPPVVPIPPSSPVPDRSPLQDPDPFAGTGTSPASTAQPPLSAPVDPPRPAVPGDPQVNVSPRPPSTVATESPRPAAPTNPPPGPVSAEPLSVPISTDSPSVTASPSPPSVTASPSPAPVTSSADPPLVTASVDPPLVTVSTDSPAVIASSGRSPGGEPELEIISPNRPAGQELVPARLEPGPVISGEILRPSRLSRLRRARIRVTQARLTATGLVVLLLGGSLLAGYAAELNKPSPQVFLPPAMSTSTAESSTTASASASSSASDSAGSGSGARPSAAPPGVPSASAPGKSPSSPGTGASPGRGPSPGPGLPQPPVGLPEMPPETSAPSSPQNPAPSGSPSPGLAPPGTPSSGTLSGGALPEAHPGATNSGTTQPGTAPPGTAPPETAPPGPKPSKEATAAKPDAQLPPEVTPDVQHPPGPAPTAQRSPGTVPTSQQSPGAGPTAQLSPGAGTTAQLSPGVTPTAVDPSAKVTSRSAAYSPVRCDATPPAGLPRTPQKAATRGVNGLMLQAGWSYFNDGSGFHIAVPDGWTYQRVGDTYCFRSPRGARVMSLDTGRDPTADPLAESQAEERRTASSKTPPGYALIDIAPVPLLNKAADWEFRYRSRAGTPRQAGVRWFVINGQAYTLGWSTPTKNWKSDLIKIQMIRGTFYAKRTTP